MRKAYKPSTPAEMYDRALHYAHDSRLPQIIPDRIPLRNGLRKTSGCWRNTVNGCEPVEPVPP